MTSELVEPDDRHPLATPPVTLLRLSMLARDADLEEFLGLYTAGKQFARQTVRIVSIPQA